MPRYSLTVSRKEINYKSGCSILKQSEEKMGVLRTSSTGFVEKAFVVDAEA